VLTVTIELPDRRSRKKYKEEPATDVVLRRSGSGRDLDLAVLILIAAPGQPPAMPASVWPTTRSAAAASSAGPSTAASTRSRCRFRGRRLPAESGAIRAGQPGSRPSDLPDGAR
jgi:hypothetical protein